MDKLEKVFSVIDEFVFGDIGLNENLSSNNSLFKSFDNFLNLKEMQCEYKYCEGNDSKVMVLIESNFEDFHKEVASYYQENDLPVEVEPHPECNILVLRMKTKESVQEALNESFNFVAIDDFIKKGLQYVLLLLEKEGAVSKYFSISPLPSYYNIELKEGLTKSEVVGPLREFLSNNNKFEMISFKVFDFGKTVKVQVNIPVAFKLDEIKSNVKNALLKLSSHKVIKSVEYEYHNSEMEVMINFIAKREDKIEDKFETAIKGAMMELDFVNHQDFEVDKLPGSFFSIKIKFA